MMQDHGSTLNDLDGHVRIEPEMSKHMEYTADFSCFARFAPCRVPPRATRRGRPRWLIRSSSCLLQSVYVGSKIILVRVGNSCIQID